jgi:nitrite reductase (NO-forming)/hydroxylamine reductase
MVKKFLLLGAVFGAFMFVGKEAVSQDSVPNSAKQDTQPLTKQEYEMAKQIYFNRCAGCHGELRTGAIGPALTPDKMKQLGIQNIETFITYGSPKGMPDWGKSGILTPEQISVMARFLQLPPPKPPEFDLPDIEKTWRLIVPVNQRPKTPLTNKDISNYMGVVLRSANEAAIIDDATKKPVAILKVGHAIHILRTDAFGEYFYAIGRDGKVSLIDLYYKHPKIVAQVKACYDARSVEVSLYHGKEGDYRDKYAIVGCYWPPQFVILDGLTLKPLKVVSTVGYQVGTGKFIRDPRVAAIVASYFHPEWIVNVKETGQIWIVNYKDLKNLKITMVDAAPFLHDGGWNSTKRYFLTAANASNKIAVLDAKKDKLVKLIDTPKLPHPGRGANIYNPKYGPLYCSSFIGQGVVACIGTDPKHHPQYAWKVVKIIKLPGEGGGSLFIKTNPHVHYMFVDRTLNPDPKLQRQFYAIDTRTLKVVHTFNMPKDLKGRFVDFDFNKQGTELWVSDWARKGAILIYNPNTFKLEDVIKGKWVISPTGKFNVYNTVHDIY